MSADSTAPRVGGVLPAHGQNWVDMQPPQLVGRFRYSPASNTWDWDDAAALLHRRPPHGGALSTARLLTIVHPQDRDRVAGVLAEPAEALRVSYRVAVSAEDVRELLVVGHRTTGTDGPYVEGHVVDLTGELRAAGEHAAQEALAAAMEGRGAIEQAKGALMLAYGLSEDQAFSLLRWWSRNHNVRVRLLAERLMSAVLAGNHSHEELRTAFDRILHDLTTEPDAG